MFKLEVKPGIQLRQLSLEDADELFSIVDSNRERLREWHPWVDAMKSSKDFYGFIESSKDLILQKKAFPLGIFLENKIIGTCSINCIYYGSKISEIGYWISKDHEGKGIVTLCVKTLIKFSFEELNLNKIELGCAVKNLRSQKIPLKLGFLLEGQRRDAEWLYDHYVDHLKYGLLRREWRPE